MSSLAVQLGGGLPLCCAARGLAIACLRHRAILGLFCATFAAGLALVALLDLAADPAELLAGSFIAIGAGLLLLGLAVQRLLDDMSREGA